MTHMDGTGSGGGWQRPDAPLGTLVYRAGLLSKEKLETALEEGQRTGRRLGEVLLQKGWIDEKDLARLLAGQKGLSFVSLHGRGFDPEVARLLSEQLCRFHNAMPVERNGDSVLVAVADPTDEAAPVQDRQRVVTVNPLRRRRVALDPVLEAEEGRRARPVPDQVVEWGEERR